jgi:hypothetical protein
MFLLNECLLNHRRVLASRQAESAGRQVLQDDDLPFANVLTEEVIGQALTAISNWLDRIFSGRSSVWVAW